MSLPKSIKLLLAALVAAIAMAGCSQPPEETPEAETEADCDFSQEQAASSSATSNDERKELIDRLFDLSFEFFYLGGHLSDIHVLDLTPESLDNPEIKALGNDVREVSVSVGDYFGQLSDIRSRLANEYSTYPDYSLEQAKAYTGIVLRSALADLEKVDEVIARIEAAGFEILSGQLKRLDCARAGSRSLLDFMAG